MAQEAVAGFGWMRPAEMVDGLGLAETTPGPLILVTQFVGFIAAWRDAGPFTPFVAGLLGAGLPLWVTFVPCFLWIRSEEHTSELPSLLRLSSAVFCLKKNKHINNTHNTTHS